MKIISFLCLAFHASVLFASCGVRDFSSILLIIQVAASLTSYAFNRDHRSSTTGFPFSQWGAFVVSAVKSGMKRSAQRERVRGVERSARKRSVDEGE